FARGSKVQSQSIDARGSKIMKNVPYGNANFQSIRSKDQIYIDRTKYLRTL
ncbi:hypothetical protein MHK_002668, partial [Candidatus Magnetomorum sp. HK-1]